MKNFLNNKNPEDKKKAPEKSNKSEKSIAAPEKKSKAAKEKNPNQIFALLRKIWSVEAVRLATILFLITSVIAGALAFVNSFTADAIAAQNEAMQQAAMKQVMTDADGFENVDISALNLPPEINSIQTALKAGEKIGYCVDVSSIGYGGQIEMIVGVGLDGKVTTFKIVTMTETAGLGTRAQEEPFASAFNGLSYPVSLVKGATSNANEVSAMSGATITSKAVTSGINSALNAVAQVIAETPSAYGTGDNAVTGENTTPENTTGDNTTADNKATAKPAAKPAAKTTAENGGAKS